MATRADVLRLKIDVQGKNAEAAMKRFAGETEKANKRVADSSKKAASGIEATRISIARLRNASLIASFAVGATVIAIDRLADAAQRVTDLRNSFDTLGDRINATAEFLPLLQEATDGVVTNLELMKQANNAIILGLPLTERSMARLTEQATKLGRAVGLTASKSVESLIVGIGRQSRMMLDNLGIVIDSEAAYRRYAESVGLSTDELTDADRKLAFFNATVAATELAVTGLSPEVDTLATSWQKFKTSVKNATDALLDWINTQRQANTTADDAGQAFVGTLIERFFSTEELAQLSGEEVVALRDAVARIADDTLRSGSIDGFKGQGEGALRLVALSEELVASNDALEESRKKIAELTARIEEMDKLRLASEKEIRKESRATAKALEEQAALARQVAAEHQEIEVSVSEIEQGVSLTVEEMEKFVAKVQEATDAQLLFADATKTAAFSLGDTMVDAAFGAEVAWDEFFKNLLKDIARAIVQMLILKALEQSFGNTPFGAAFGFGAGVASGASGGGGGGGTTTTSIQPAGTTTITNSFTGTIVDEASVTRFFENHPEALGAGFTNARRRGTI